MSIFGAVLNSLCRYCICNCNCTIDVENDTIFSTSNPSQTEFLIQELGDVQPALENEERTRIGTLRGQLIAHFLQMDPVKFVEKRLTDAEIREILQAAHRFSWVEQKIYQLSCEWKQHKGVLLPLFVQNELGDAMRLTDLTFAALLQLAAIATETITHGECSYHRIESCWVAPFFSEDQRPLEALS